MFPIRFKNHFQGSFNPLCNCTHNIESTTHLLLHNPLFSTLSSPDRNLFPHPIENSFPFWRVFDKFI